ncbi:MAG: thioredoxin family protein [Bacteroidales bacterium]|jgi:thiol-disulfide isomerase/thioredoxin
MRKLLILIIPLICFAEGCRVKKPAAEIKPSAGQSATTEYITDFMDQTTWILGYFRREQLYRTPHCEWYLSGYDGYHPDTLVINKLRAIPATNVKIKIIMGTWCPDSRREVPRFLHVLDLWKFPEQDVVFIGVDDEKRSPVAEYQDLNIQRVPTFIIYENNIETGRIIENPRTSLEQDIVNILTKKQK